MQLVEEKKTNNIQNRLIKVGEEKLTCYSGGMEHWKWKTTATPTTISNMQWNGTIIVGEAVYVL